MYAFRMRNLFTCRTYNTIQLTTTHINWKKHNFRLYYTRGSAVSSTAVSGARSYLVVRLLTGTFIVNKVRSLSFNFYIT